MRLRNWLLGMVRRFRFGGFLPRFLRPFRPRSAFATIRSCFLRRGRRGALPGTMHGKAAEARARKARRQLIRRAVRFTPGIGTLEPRVMLSANDADGSAVPHNKYTFETTSGAADVLQISSVNEGGNQWGVISRLSEQTVTELKRFRGYETVIINTGAGDDSVTLSSSLNADGLKSLQINTDLGDDTVNLSAVNPSPALEIKYDGGDGSDKLVGFNQPSVWKVNAAGGGSLGSASYANVETVNLNGKFEWLPALGNPTSLLGDDLIQARTDIHATTVAMNEGLAALTGQASDLKNAFDGNRFLNVNLPLVDKSLKSVLQPGTTMQSVLGAGQAVGDYLSQHDTAFDLLTIKGPSGPVVVGARDSSGVTTYATFDASTATDGSIQTALQALPAIGSGNVKVTPVSAGVFRIERASGSLKALPPLALAVEADATLRKEVGAPTGAPYTLGITGGAGVYVLESGQSGANRVTLPFDATAAAIQTQLRTLSGCGAVTVTPVVGSARSFTIGKGTGSVLPEIAVVEAAEATLKLDAIDAAASSTAFPTLAGMASALKSALDAGVPVGSTTTVAAILDGVNHSLSFEIQLTRSKSVDFNVALGAGLADLGLDLGALPPEAPQFEATAALSIDVGFGVSLATLAGPRTGTPVTPGTPSPIVAGSLVPFPRASDFSIDVKQVEASATAALSGVNLPLVPTAGNTGSGLRIVGGQASLAGKVDVAFGDATAPGHVGFGGIQSLASQAGGGAIYAFSDRVTLDLGYRFFSLGSGSADIYTTNAAGTLHDTVKTQFVASEALLTLRIYEPFRRWR